MLKKTFYSLLKNYADNEILITELWDEIETHYSSKKRHYHSLTHLENLLVQLLEVKDKINQWETVVFSLYYHDIIYNARKSDNEEKSAELAKERLSHLGVSNEIIDQCVHQIIATKSHTQSENSDTNYFTDADLSILGQDWATYSTYFQNVRKEYSIYPDLVYKPGRKKVLKHFLEMDRIFKTDYFYDMLEIQAKENLRKELELLSE